MYPNLKAEMARKGITITALAELIGMPDGTLYPKLRGDKPVTMREAVKIKNALNADATLDYLFTEREGA